MNRCNLLIERFRRQSLRSNFPLCPPPRIGVHEAKVLIVENVLRILVDGAVGIYSALLVYKIVDCLATVQDDESACADLK
jgi:hypothetical protein